MRGEITLESELGRGTKARFWIPFNKPQFTGKDSPLIDLGYMPDRLRSELSVSGCPSMPSGDVTPPISPQGDFSGHVIGQQRNALSGSSSIASLVASREDNGLEIDRKKVHVLVVEDK